MEEKQLGNNVFFSQVQQGYPRAPSIFPRQNSEIYRSGRSEQQQQQQQYSKVRSRDSILLQRDEQTEATTCKESVRNPMASDWGELFHTLNLLCMR